MALTRHRVFEPNWPLWANFLGDRYPLSWPEPLVEAIGELAIRIEDREVDGAYVVRAELPGVDPDRDVEITLGNSELQLKVERRQEEHSSDAHVRHSEFRYGSFTRVVRLPDSASEEGVTASYAAGILEIRVPLGNGKPASRRISITKR